MLFISIPVTANNAGDAMMDAPKIPVELFINALLKYLMSIIISLNQLKVKAQHS